MRTSGIRFQPSARMQPLRRPKRDAVSREVRKPVRRPASTIGSRSAWTPSSSHAKLPSPPAVVGSAVMFMCSEPYSSEPMSPGFRKPCPRTTPRPVDAVELGGVPDGLVHLERDLVRVEHDRRDPARADVCAQEGARLLGDARRLVHEAEPVDVLPAELPARAHEEARVAA